MHDIDRALFEAMPNESATYGEDEIYGEQETYGEDEIYGEEEIYGEQETYGEEEIYGEQSLGQGESTEFGEWGTTGEEETYGGVDGRELALASELLALNSEDELDRFLGNLISGAVSAAKNFASSDAGRAVGKVLKDSARRALPQIGRAVGNYLAPGRGGDVGQRLGQAAAASFETGLQTEGLSPEDRELQNARAFVRYARATALNTARTSRRVPPSLAARRAAVIAAQRYLPGLLRASGSWGTSAQRPSVSSPYNRDFPPGPVPGAGTNTPGRNQGGRWVRRGRNIVLFGAG
ncbi:hypothetical protein [Rhodococcus sp. NPDC047139]|uniref:hypothetical protein n=1 Tax=Rhodococcus sp. NPDC047139 TaxID=3155141 RepID=UPI0033F310C3